MSRVESIRAAAQEEVAAAVKAIADEIVAKLSGEPRDVRAEIMRQVRERYCASCGGTVTGGYCDWCRK